MECEAIVQQFQLVATTEVTARSQRHKQEEQKRGGGGGEGGLWKRGQGDIDNETSS